MQVLGLTWCRANKICSLYRILGYLIKCIRTACFHTKYFLFTVIFCPNLTNILASSNTNTDCSRLTQLDSLLDYWSTHYLGPGNRISSYLFIYMIYVIVGCGSGNANLKAGQSLQLSLKANWGEILWPPENSVPPTLVFRNKEIGDKLCGKHWKKSYVPV
jgi:hypothetical protein